MGYKTISLSEEAYEVLRKSKRENESFSQVVIRLAQKRTLRDFVDCISDDSVVKLSKALEDFRKERSELWAQSMEELVS
jgi:predicted CopG family antitoxin